MAEDDEEMAARAAVVRCGARLWARGLVSGTSGNVSVRLADGDLIVTPAGRALARLDPDELVRTDPDGHPRDRAQRPSSELPLHVAAYRVRADATAFVHTHATFCVVWSKVGRLFPLDTVSAREALGVVAFTTYEPPGSLALAKCGAMAFAGGANTIIMERHGASSLGTNLEEAFLRADAAEEVAKVAYYGALLEQRMDRT